MPWHALPYTERGLQQQLGAQFGVRGIPAVVLLNSSGALLDANGRSKVMAPSFPSTLPRVLGADDSLPPVEGPVVLRVSYKMQEFELEVDPEEGWEVLRMQLYSITEVPSEQQRLFGLGIEKGPVDESVPLYVKALAFALHVQKSSDSPYELHCQKPPLIVVIGNWSQGDPFEVSGAPPSEMDKMIKEQQLAFLQAKLSSAPPRLQHQAHSLQHVFQYEDLALQRQALDQIPVVRIHECQKADTRPGGFESSFMRGVLHWYKHEFFKWTNAPQCENCGSMETKG
eukprot:CAMPEP_0169293516 /NCGR_PEP_ID=MMETSP1016-20121227/63335_1 /TAXON_ID=342587 /ORGANISM="Karlodinium micrum, Strain CCMP2283" /LENGTH=283 /DNA_ID=CAMNT_0009384219 /DNA_START=24 /DNA_END=873 /DNA_ORIENTATION=+